MSELIDISVRLHEGMPQWPGSAPFRLRQTSTIADGAHANVSALSCDVHVGTHIDAPCHFCEGGASIDQIALATLVGPATVCHLPHTAEISRADLESLELPRHVRRLLCRTRNSALWASGAHEFCSDYVALSPGAAEWIVERQMLLVGVDYLSVQRFGDGPQTHRILLGANVVVVEGLDLSAVEAGEYELLCLPLRLVGADGAPARAALRARAGGSTP